MRINLPDFILIEDENQLNDFVKENESINWMGFDTEFIGEKRYYTLLCLIQVATEHGFYLIDTLKLEDLKPFLDMVENPDILKITHAGENDYKLLYTNYQIIPKNIVDVQVAAGFVGYRYPVSFQKLCERELGVRVSKGYTVSDWEARPMNQKQIKYALNDVIYLEELWKTLLGKLDHLGRLEWLLEELEPLQTKDYYEFDPHKEALNSNLMPHLQIKEQVFLLRLISWRRETARQRNHSRDMVLASKHIGPIVKLMRQGKRALKHHRRLPDHLISTYWETFRDLFEAPIKDAEREVLDKLPHIEPDDGSDDLTMDLIHLLLKYKCVNENLSPDLLLSRTSFKRMKSDKSFFDPLLGQGWRAVFLGADLIEWLRRRDEVTVDFQQGKVEVKLAELNPSSSN